MNGESSTTPQIVVSTVSSDIPTSIETSEAPFLTTEEPHIATTAELVVTSGLTTKQIDETTTNEVVNQTTENQVAQTTAPPTTAIVYGECECSSTDKNNLSAAKCDQNDECVDCDDISSCGTQENWTEWSECSVTCGGGTRTRSECFIWANRPEECDDESEDCNENDCPAWAAWKPWSSCSAQCKVSNGDDPIRSRYRCWDPEDGNGEECAGGEKDSGSGETCGRDADDVCYQEQTETCNEDIECTLECEWTEWGEWSDCTPACKDGLRIRRRENNEDQGASCDGAGAQSGRCTDVEAEECPVCLNYYEKCDKIPTSFCTDIRYKAQLERLCNKYCGYCSNRRKRSIFNRFPKPSDIALLDYLANYHHDL